MAAPRLLTRPRPNRVSRRSGSCCAAAAAQIAQIRIVGDDAVSSKLAAHSGRYLRAACRPRRHRP